MWCIYCSGTVLPSELQTNQSNINALELLAIQYALQCFSSEIEKRHVLIQCDNTTAVSYIANMGGTHSMMCNNIAKQIWLWSISKKSWITATHIPGKTNTVADFQSRHFNERTEWELNPKVFEEITSRLGEPTIDLFASYLNSKLPCYYSWKSDPRASHIDAFTISWHGPLMYCFPPFSLLGRCLHPKLQLVACRLSGDRWKVDRFLESLPTSSWLHGAVGPKNSTTLTSTSGSVTVVKNKLIAFTQV